MEQDLSIALWSRLPPILLDEVLEEVFAGLPLRQVYQLRSLSTYWRDLTPSFREAFDATQERRFAIVAQAHPGRNGLWSFGTNEKKWTRLPFDYIPECNLLVAADGGLVCCRRDVRDLQDMQLCVCNPLTREWRLLPLPALVEEASVVHMVTDTGTRRYTITIADTAFESVEIYDSITNMWNPSDGDHLGENRFWYYKCYSRFGLFAGVRAYDKITRKFTITDIDDLWIDASFSEYGGFFSFAQHHGEVYVLRTGVETSGIWVHRVAGWEKWYFVPNSEVLPLFSLSLYVCSHTIFIFGDSKELFHGEGQERKLMGQYFWMMDRTTNTWTETPDASYEFQPRSQVVFTMRMCAVP